MIEHRPYVRGGHVESDGLDGCGRVAQSFSERLQCIRPLAVTDEDDGAAFEVEGHVEDRDVLRELEDVPLEGPGVGEAGIGKAEIDLADIDIAAQRQLHGLAGAE